MEHEFTRTEMLIGTDALERLKRANVIIFGVGGVGGYTCEALARSGIGRLTLVDKDTVSITNINRQILALHSTIGMYKVDVAQQRIGDINPECCVEARKMFYLPENADDIDLSQYDYVIDCIDTVKAKLELARRCHRLSVPFISSMGAANKMDATGFRVADIQKTQTDPLAKVIRKQLRKEGINHIKVVYSEETPMKPYKIEDLSTINDTTADGNTTAGKRQKPASNAFVHAAAGLVIAAEVVKDLCKI